ncbi:MAG: hypothetical protein H6640_07695 [Caldilineaceae bacterium]|nr:hypothetical protein [Caldilineaceae bacterium]
MDAPSPLSILLLVSSPHEAAVSVRDDLHALHAAVDDLPYAAEFVTCVAESDALLRVLNRYDRPPFRLLHFIGHGAPTATPARCWPSRAGWANCACSTAKRWRPCLRRPAGRSSSWPYSRPAT